MIIFTTKTLKCHTVIAQKLQNIFTWNKKQMKDKYIQNFVNLHFRVIRTINLSKFPDHGIKMADVYWWD